MLGSYIGLQVTGGAPGAFCVGHLDYGATLTLLHFDGATATDFVDSSAYARTVSRAAGAAGISSSVSKFGGKSLVGADSSSRITIATGAEWAGRNWTWDCWTSRNASFVRFGLAYLNVNLQVNYDGTEGFGTYKICVDLSGIRVMQSLASFPSGEQHHVCLSCQQISGSNVTVRLFVDGVIQATMSSTDTNWALAPSVVAEIGRTSFSGFAGIRGSVDEWRMRTGYLTADFTPESYPYCSSASAPSNPPPATAETVNTSFANLVVGSTISMAADSTAAVSGPVPLRQIAIAAGSTQVVGTPRPGAPFSVNESAAAVTVWVYGQLPFTVDWETYDITAIAGVHYTAASGTIAAVAAVNQFNVALLGGANTTFGDPARKFGVRLLNPSTGCELMPGAEQVEITILDDELAPGISFAAAPLGPGGEIQFDATLSNVGAVDLSFNYRISYAGVPASWLVGTASYSVDLTNYTLIGLATFGGTVVFPAGVTTIRIRQDLTLSGASPRPLCRMTLQGSTGQYSSPTF